MSEDDLSRRALMTGGVAIVAGAAGFAFILSESNTASPSDPRPTPTQPLIATGTISRLTIQNDISVSIQVPAPQLVLMQTNGVVLCLETIAAITAISLEKLVIEVEDTGHDIDGNQIQVGRSLSVRDYLHGPYNEMGPISDGAHRYYLVLSDRIYNQSDTWRTRITQVRLADGWAANRLGETIAGELVEREDTLPYPNFPVKTPTLPFQRVDGATPLRFEVATINEFARNGAAVARVEGWASVLGMTGPIAVATAMTASGDAGATAPSGLPVPLYALSISSAGLLDGAGQIFYKLYPWIGPPWDSQSRGEPYPTLNAPQSLPFCSDPSGSYLPLYGIVSQDGAGLPGTDLRGLSTSITGAKASSLKYKDVAAVAAAVRTFNASASPKAIADGNAVRPMPHNDIAGGAAVLLAIDGSVQGANAGSYALRTGFASQTLFPPGLTPFEIRSESGLAEEKARLRGVLPSGAAVAAAGRLVPSRLLLRGVWLDGTGTTGAANSVIDGTVAAGASLTPLSAQSAGYLLTVDCVITENLAAGSASPARLRPGYVWDVRLRHVDPVGVVALHTVASYSGLVAAIGCAYQRSTVLDGLICSTLLGCSFKNIGVKGQIKSIQPLIKGVLAVNVRIDFDQAFSTPPIHLADANPAMDGLALANVFVRGTVDSGGALIRLAADGTLRECDNVIMQHFGHDLTTASIATNGRANLMYQDQGYVRVDKRGAIMYCAFRCYTAKGDVFPATEKASAAGTTWTNIAYDKGSIVWDTSGAATAASIFYQAIRNIPVGGAALTDVSAWQRIGAVFGKTYGAQPLRQGNAGIRYHIGCRGNVASLTYNGGAFPGTSSGYGFVWGADEDAKADFLKFYRDRAANDYRPNAKSTGDALDSPLLDRVPAGYAALPFDLVGTPRLNDGTGAAGAYERPSRPAPPPFVTSY